jgi:peptidoglycan/LPS O-acetylase OafA/YrhL
MRSAPPGTALGKRNYALDILRGLAVLLVVLRHIPLAGKLPQPFRTVQPIGWVGVDLFFVLSGFLISSLLFEEQKRTGRLNVVRFWCRREMKIWPAYFVAFGIFTAGQLIATKSGPTYLRNVLTNVVFIQNYITTNATWPASWSIAVEEHFYFALPLLLLALGKRRGLVPLLAIVCVATLAGRVLAVRMLDVKSTPLIYRTHFRVDALAFGVLIGYAFAFHRPLLERVARFWPLLIIFPLPPLALVYFFPQQPNPGVLSYALTLLYLGFGGLVALAAVRPTFGTTGPRIFRLGASALAWAGIYSYTIYLANATLPRLFGYHWMHPFLGNRVPLVWLAYFGASLGGGFLLSHAVERPALVLRSRWFPSETRARDVEATPPAVEPQPAVR